MGIQADNKDQCCICGYKPVEKVPTDVFGTTSVTCACCGKYLIQRSVELNTLAGDVPQDRLCLLSGVIRNQNEMGLSVLNIPPNTISDEWLTEHVASLVPRNIDDRVAALMKYIERGSAFPGCTVELDPLKDYPIAYCRNSTEFEYYVRYVLAQGLVETTHDVSGLYLVCVTVHGWEWLEARSERNLESKQAFVAMSFNEEHLHVFTDGIEPLEEETGYKMLRIDMKEFNDDVVAEIRAEIRRSRFLIADATIPSNGVYFEAGYAMGEGIPVIWCCREDAIKNAHFDTNHFSHVVWKDVEELKKKLKNRIEGTIQ